MRERVAAANSLRSLSVAARSAQQIGHGGLRLSGLVIAVLWLGYSRSSARASGCAACQARKWNSSSARTGSDRVDESRETSTVFGPTCSAT
jgi:hypothetical protein